MKKIAVIIAGIMLACTFSPAEARSASAFRHLSPDAGFDGPIQIRCIGSSYNVSVAEGATVLCHQGQQYLYVGAGNQVKCWSDSGTAYTFGTGIAQYFDFTTALRRQLADNGCKHQRA